MADSLYRIIDANFNRAREAFRVMEEYCRFTLNNSSLSARAKQSRHQLCESLKAIDQMQLLYNRDTLGDIGRTLKIEGHQKRTSIEDCFTAAAKRASEALRALAESTQTIDSTVAPVMEKLRFEVYAIEKEALLLTNKKAKLKPVRLYVLINAEEQTDDNGVLSLVKACIDGGADCIQLRAKDITDQHYLKLARSFTDYCRRHKTLSIINDRTDIAILSEADGVHLGQNEISAEDARKLANRPLIVGVSTHNKKELLAAIKTNCDYVGIGPAFPSPTKPDVKVAGLGYIQEALEVLRETNIFHVAIGGINHNNLADLINVGVFTVAVSGAIGTSKNAKTSCQGLKSILLDTPI